MRILLSNDDGYRAPGLKALADGLAGLADLTVVAPEANRSGASNSLTLEAPLRVYDAGPDWYFVNGTPTDCVLLAISGLFDQPFNRVVSGINDGANLGDDVLYSGTVAAAVEGRFLGLPTMAMSLVVDHPHDAGTRQHKHFETAARVARELLEREARHPLPQSTILNVNVPDLPYEQLKGYQATRLGFRHRSEAVIRDRDARGRTIYWIGPAGKGQDAGPGTDFHAVANGYVSVTPLQIDLTRHVALEGLGGWLREPT
jgi:5'-nucleotidase